MEPGERSAHLGMTNKNPIQLIDIGIKKPGDPRKA